MFLSAVLFVLFLAGCWLYCLTDAALTPEADFPGLRKRTWIAVIAVTFILGAIAWFITRGRRRSMHWPLNSAGQAAVIAYDAGNARWYPDRPPTAYEEALARHPASRAKRADGLGRTAPIGPDDDPEFLRQLSERIRGEHRDQ